MVKEILQHIKIRYFDGLDVAKCTLFSLYQRSKGSKFMTVFFVAL